MSYNYFWLGPLVNDKFLTNNNAISPAANEWQYNFIETFNNQCPITVISYLPNQIFPKGPFFSLFKKILKPSNITIKTINYLNVIFFKSFTISIGLLFNLFFENSTKNSQNIIFTYNPELHYRIAISIFKLFRKTIWISIVADDYCKGYPNKTIFLSHGYYLKVPISEKYFFDGAIKKNNFSNSLYLHKPEIIKLFYIGSISKWTGIIELINDFKKYNCKLKIEIHIIGKDNQKLIGAYEENNVRIITHGFVDDYKIDSLIQDASFFINPRPTNIKSGENNFPSKILYYLKYKKPIISTKTEGLACYYDDILCYYENFTDLENLLLKLTVNLDFFYEKVFNIINFTENNTWDKKISNLIRELDLPLTKKI